MALGPDGKIVVVGYTGASLLVLRCLPNGALDMTFDGDGKATFLNLQYAVCPTSVTVQAASAPVYPSDRKTPRPLKPRTPNKKAPADPSQDYPTQKVVAAAQAKRYRPPCF